MFNKILVAIDTSESSDRVFDRAIVIAKATGAHLMLLHVLSSEEQGSPYLPIIFSGMGYAGGDKIIENYREEWAVFAQQCLKMLKSRQEQAMLAGVKAEFTQTPGSPGKTICDFAQKWEADTIVIGHRGHSGVAKLILGSVSNYVLHHAGCSLLIVQ
ncbi:universal stress protein [Synechocystis sp. PCC 7509]|uniref:universal stress protein n=1 Tax=Synechocystis sp. PCC 7509 TaxID=927677 RepID=UPI0002ACE16C|nr:universal stress protein [Synechocystis sp. PCC 7509]